MHIIIGLLIAFLLVMLYERKNRTSRMCRWRADHSGDQDILYKYKCAACGAETYTKTKSPPNLCLSDRV
ncbi:hypothetical protein CEP88_18000 [Roseobacter denitrificans]|uniref:Uncharacterized protein n=1 Tax=Roseobacter denitrificans (strain ATCC 33942 / OCh 114) TaxID=375451 RepID=Q169T4_ROSDO|nr:hypothetical protein [Roseobacter denitrificans]ABG31259.1 hypothetical protein RD1_1632 [Roseobacter denitrificans OCh 114]AVL54307.1 hypothetical protein CEP88_18000 [Roseobacter denitrificans]SFF98647.1 hypothetical protein SAMN05443635_10584 [Roseobacter denitrificans OCh 114]